MANFRKQAFAQRLRDYMLSERGSMRKSAASPIEYPPLQGAPEGEMPPEQGMGMDPAMLEQIAAATGMDPQQLAQMSPEQLDQLIQQLQGAPQEAASEQQGSAQPTLNITAKGDIAVETVNNMMGTKMASANGAHAILKRATMDGGWLNKLKGWFGMRPQPKQPAPQQAPRLATKPEAQWIRGTSAPNSQLNLRKSLL